MAGAFSSAFSNAFDIAHSVGCAFTNAFSPAFDVCPVAPDTGPIIEVDGKRRPDREPERRAERLARQQLLRDAVRSAFAEAYGETEADTPTAVPQPLPEREVRRFAMTMLPELNAEGIKATLAEVMGLLDEYQQTLIAERRMREDEEAMVLLMLMN